MKILLRILLIIAILLFSLIYLIESSEEDKAIELAKQSLKYSKGYNHHRFVQNEGGTPREELIFEDNNVKLNFYPCKCRNPYFETNKAIYTDSTIELPSNQAHHQSKVFYKTKNGNLKEQYWNDVYIKQN